MSVRQTVIEAISNRFPLRMRKRGELGTRLVHPHILFHASPESGINLSAWQLSNSGKPFDEPAWRMFNLEDIVMADIQGGTFVVHGDFNPSSPMYSGEVIASVSV